MSQLRLWDTPTYGSTEWSTWRMTNAHCYLSASEVGTAAGLNPWDTPLDLLDRKLLPTDDHYGDRFDEETLHRFRVGHHMEVPAIQLAIYQEPRLSETRQSGRSFRPPITATRPYLLATPDAFTPDMEPVEVKTTAAWALPDTPPYILAQMATQLEVTGAPAVWLIVARPHRTLLIDVQVRRYTTADLDKHLPGGLATMWERVDQWWQALQQAIR